MKKNNYSRMAGFLFLIILFNMTFCSESREIEIDDCNYDIEDFAEDRTPTETPLFPAFLPKF